MRKVETNFAKGKSIYVGIDVHKKDWTVHIVCEGCIGSVENGVFEHMI